LIAQRYLSTVQVARIFRDGQPINRIRVDFRSNDDVQKILQCSHLSIDSIRYPAVPYKPLARIDRCFRCQQFGHKAIHCSNKSKCYKCGENHEYNRDCANVVKCANCNAQHMAGSPECLVKIAYRREKRQQQEERRETNQQPSTAYLSSPARLYSSVLQTMAPHVHAETTTRKMTSGRPPGQIDQSSIIINALNTCVFVEYFWEDTVEFITSILKCHRVEARTHGSKFFFQNGIDQCTFPSPWSTTNH
jgi:hypothetical protein